VIPGGSPGFPVEIGGVGEVHAVVSSAAKNVGNIRIDQIDSPLVASAESWHLLANKSAL
jgi:hypothetical protein